LRYRLSNPQIIHETIDGETIVIDLATGTYYSLRGSGGEIWEHLIAGTDTTEMASRLCARYSSVDGEIGRAVETLVAQLTEAALIVPAGDADAGHEEAVEGTGQAGGPFVAPVFEQFTDMQDIILLDPVHEVGSRGWPHAESA
jgi:hypothetical protein